MICQIPHKNSKHFEDVENTITSNLTLLENFFKKWRHRPNPLKTMVTAFHLNNKEANRRINSIFLWGNHP